MVAVKYFLKMHSEWKTFCTLYRIGAQQIAFPLYTLDVRDIVKRRIMLAVIIKVVVRTYQRQFAILRNVSIYTAIAVM